MGSGRWDNASYESYASTTNYRSASREQVFTSRNLREDLDPARIKLRESCDSVDNPLSTPIILALDVTGSMGMYAEKIAKESLPELMGAILEERPVTDPHLMFMGIDDVHSHSGGPLQASQFEADIRIIETLRNVWLVGGGGGNRSESYDLAWYFAANKTAIDSYTKRNKKGYLFTFGDEEAPYQNVSSSQLKSVFGAGQYQETTPAQMLEAAQKMYNVFHIVIEQGSHCSHSFPRVKSTWTEMMGPNVLFLKDFRNLSELVVSTLKIAEGADIDQILFESQNATALRHAYQNALQG